MTSIITSIILKTSAKSDKFDQSFPLHTHPHLSTHPPIHPHTHPPTHTYTHNHLCTSYNEQQRSGSASGKEEMGKGKGEERGEEGKVHPEACHVLRIAQKKQECEQNLKTQTWTLLGWWRDSSPIRPLSIFFSHSNSSALSACVSHNSCIINMRRSLIIPSTGRCRLDAAPASGFSH